MEVRSRVKGLDLIDRMPGELSQRIQDSHFIIQIILLKLEMIQAKGKATKPAQAYLSTEFYYRMLYYI